MGSAGRSKCCRDWGSEFDPQCGPDGTREQTLSTHALPPTYTLNKQTNKYFLIFKKIKPRQEKIKALKNKNHGRANITKLASKKMEERE